MTTAKIELTLGALQVKCEASEQFLAGELLAIIGELTELDIPNMVATSDEVAVIRDAGSASATVPAKSKLSTSDFAVRMGAKSGSDLVMAAAACLHHTHGSEEFRRADILNQMKSAKAFYRASYGGNLSKSLDMLTKSGRLGNPRLDHFSLPYAEIESTSSYLK